MSFCLCTRVQCPCWPEDGNRSPGSRVLGFWTEYWDLNSGPLWEQQQLFHSWAISLVPFCMFKLIHAAPMSVFLTGFFLNVVFEVHPHWQHFHWGIVFHYYYGYNTIIHTLIFRSGQSTYFELLFSIYRHLCTVWLHYVWGHLWAGYGELNFWLLGLYSLSNARC